MSGWRDASVQERQKKLAAQRERLLEEGPVVGVVFLPYGSEPRLIHTFTSHLKTNNHGYSIQYSLHCGIPPYRHKTDRPRHYEKFKTVREALFDKEGFSLCPKCFSYFDPELIAKPL